MTNIQVIPLICAIVVAVIVAIAEGIVEDTSMRALFPIILDMADNVEQLISLMHTLLQI